MTQYLFQKLKDEFKEFEIMNTDYEKQHFILKSCAVLIDKHVQNYFNILILIIMKKVVYNFKNKSIL